ncbi:hypothetical protein RR48_01727 [Papilio machaon]|uniref:Vitellinogen open beta-sheet domain-containing protein n=1 Tax=Papilio machaon TaxID=76193 RepID=A0A0N1IH84_PAPMA|nr:hypothetical protein RR48_01727 [Papilio machaon]
MVYTAVGDSIKKYCSVKVSSPRTEHSWSSVPWTQDYEERNVPEMVSTSERVYILDENRGLNSMDMKGMFQYKIHDHILYVASELSLYYDTEVPVESLEKLELTRRDVQYDAGDYRNPSNFIKIVTQEDLKNKTYEILLKIAKKGIDADNIVKNEGLIHTMDFVDLLNTMSRLTYDSFKRLFDELVLGTSYDLETARNIFLEVLPHSRSDACARFIRYLVIDQKIRYVGSRQGQQEDGATLRVPMMPNFCEGVRKYFPEVQKHSAEGPGAFYWRSRDPRSKNPDNYHILFFKRLFDELVLGTSYDLETARNIFLEVLPHSRSDACARFIRYLVIDQKEKIEDSSLLSLLRKLPYNVADYSQSLLEELEVFTRLGLDFPPSIRHAGILSFATLASKTMDASLVKHDYFDNVVVKFFRMYSDCPQYLDRMVWLQGLCTLGYTADSYIRTIHGDITRNRHERLWASLACGPETAKGYMVLETALPILTNDREHIQLRVAALHSLLSSDISASDFLFIHNYIKECNNDQLKRFWYSTVKTMEKNKFFHGYKAASLYVPFISSQVTNPGTTYWSTNNLVFTVGDDEDTASVHFFSVGEPDGPMPAMGGIKLSTGGRRPYQPSIYFVGEGLSWVLLKKLLQSRNMSQGTLISMLEKLSAWKLRTPEPVHIDIVVKIGDKTVFAMHINQSDLEETYNDKIFKFIDDFLKFGSHINQQLVYYPFQMDWNIASELGTPVRLQRTIVGFSSVRGNLTAHPETQGLTWDNDLQITYQGTAVTSLCTDGPILLSEHTTRIQQSIVALLPMKFNVSHPLNAKKIELTLLFPFTQRAGLALHSRVMVNMVTIEGSFENIVITGKDTCQRRGVTHPFLSDSLPLPIISSYGEPVLIPYFFQFVYPQLQCLLHTTRLTLLFPFTQRAGLALHSRVMVNMVTIDGSFENIVITGKDTCEREHIDGVSDDRPLSGAETTGKLMTHVFDLLTPLKSSQIALESILLLNFPPSGTCGATIFVSSLKNYGEGKVTLELGVNRWNFLTEEDKIDVDFSFAISFYILNQNREEPVIKVYSETSISSQDGNLTAEVAVRGKLPDTFHNITDRYVRLCYLQEVSTQTAADQDLYSYPSSYLGQIILLLDFSKEYRTCYERAENKLKIQYKGTPKNTSGVLERHVEFQIQGKQGIDLVRHVLPKRVLETAKDLFSGSYDKDSINAEAEMKEKNGMIHVKSKTGSEVKFRSDNLEWLLDSFTTMQVMTKYGLYRECRLQESTVETLYGTTEQLLSVQSDAIALADCSDFSSFAIIRDQNGGVKVYTGLNNITVRGGSVNVSIDEPNFRVRTIGDGVKITSLVTGVTVYVRYTETVILVPHSYMGTLCGECVGRSRKYLDYA